MSWSAITPPGTEKSYFKRQKHTRLVVQKDASLNIDWAIEDRRNSFRLELCLTVATIYAPFSDKSSQNSST